MKQPVIGIIEYNRPDLTSKAIISAHETAGMDHRIILVINSPRTASQISPEAKKLAGALIQPRSNIGYTKAANLIIRSAMDQDVVLLNSDTWCEDDWLKALHQAAYNPYLTEKIGMACPQLIEKYGIHKNKQCGHSGSGCDKGPGPIWLFKGWFGFAVAYLKRNMIDDIGMLDEKHFNYGSDKEYGLRAASRGYHTAHTHLSKVHHIVQGSQRGERNW